MGVVMFHVQQRKCLSLRAVISVLSEAIFSRAPGRHSTSRLWIIPRTVPLIPLRQSKATCTSRCRGTRPIHWGYRRSNYQPRSVTSRLGISGNILMKISIMARSFPPPPLMIRSGSQALEFSVMIVAFSLLLDFRLLLPGIRQTN